jgi:hypothetical protein
MKETTQVYMQRIQGKLAGQDPLKVQAATAKKLSRLIKDISPAKLRKRLAPEKWSATEIVAHLADVEMLVKDNRKDFPMPEVHLYPLP